MKGRIKHNEVQKVREIKRNIFPAEKSSGYRRKKLNPGHSVKALIVQNQRNKENVTKILITIGLKIRKIINFVGIPPQ